MLACRRAFRIGFRVIRVVSVPSLAPFPHISVHIEKAESIWLPGADRMCLSTRILAMPSYFVEISGSDGGSGTRSVLPLGLGRQTVRKSVILCVQPLYEPLRVFPRNIVNRTVAATLTETARIQVHLGKPLNLSDLISTYPKSLAYLHAVDRRISPFSGCAVHARKHGPHDQ